MFRLEYLTNNEKGISPVVGVILMVAVTVMLGAVVGGVVLEIGQNSTNGGNVQAAADFEQSPEGVTVQYTTEGNSDGLVVLVDGQEVEGAILENAGDTVTVTAGADEEVSVVGFKGSAENRESENTIVTEEARSDTTGGSDPTVVSGGTSGGTSTVSGLVAINPNISGATVELVDSTGSVLKTTTTDSNGEYSFDVEDTSNKSVVVSVEGFTDTELSHPLYASAKQDVGESNTVDFNFQNEYQATVDGSTVLVSNDISETSTNTISTIEQLQALDGKSGSYELVSDIDASSTSTWNSGKGFKTPYASGLTLEGNGYTISNVTIDRPSSPSSHILDADTIRNLNIDNPDITGDDFTSPIAASTVANVHVTSGSITGSTEVSGLVPILSSGESVSNSSSTATVTGSGKVGGLVGDNRGYVSNSKYDGTINGDSKVGGIAGTNRYGIISKSYSTGTIGTTADGDPSSDSKSGGLVGRSSGTDAIISNSYSRMNVSAVYIAGGLVGANESGSEVKNSYSTGTVTDESGSYEGGLIGKSRSATTNNSYWDTESSGQASSAGGTGLTTSEMSGSSASSNMSGFDYTNTWTTVTGDYPELQE